MSPALASLLGYDPAHVAALAPGHRRALALVAGSALPGVALLGLAAGHGTYLASDAPVLGAVVGLGAAAYLLNLLRVSVAGGGVAPHLPVKEVSTWAPRAVPLVMLGLLGVFFAQPLIVGLLAREQDGAIQELEAALVEMHQAAVLSPARQALADARARLEAATSSQQAHRRRLDAAGAELEQLRRRPGEAGGAALERVLMATVEQEAGALREAERELEDARRLLAEWTATEARLLAADVAPYRAHLERSHFLLRRVQLTWARPLRPVALSLAMVLLMVLPWVASATVGRAAHRAYETRRWAHTRAVVEVAHEATRRLEAEALSAWPTFGGLREERFEDPPYDTRPRRSGPSLRRARG